MMMHTVPQQCLQSSNREEQPKQREKRKIFNPHVYCIQSW